MKFARLKCICGTVKLVELTGPSGAGKSAIYKQMLEYGGFVPNPTLQDQYALGALRKYGPRVPGFKEFVVLLNDGPASPTREQEGEQ